ncbi:TonB-dependent siderophore receptor [Massilia forsythiae]|uniref:TonB-dependent siderophore receptor n=1 Tax=Massilia forsythiae TaxID=2728020 RepID=A0A7Z2ZUF0_9BURK|nr:TonB-dependent siderophore receptor [Massilia forsythiae]QJE02488.1 TonB-dependent siderophore receptor [Massilia forsythiae]
MHRTTIVRGTRNSAHNAARSNARIAALVAGLFAGAGHTQAQANGPAAADNDAAAPDAAAVQTVTINGEREREGEKARSRGALGSRSDLDTPFATATVTSEQLEDRQVASLAQVFAEDASVTAKGGTYTQSAHAIAVRGLALDFTNGFKIDGQPFQMYGVELPLETIESVQLLKGATGFLYGFSAPGGIVNYVTKKPTEERTASVDIGYASASLRKAHLDAGGRFGSERRFGYRANLVHEQGDTYNGVRLKRDAASLALDARITRDLTWNASLLYQERDLDGGAPTVSLQVYPAAARLPAPVDGRINYGAYATSYYDSTMWMATSGVDWQINRDWKANVTYGHSYKRIDSAYETLYLTNAAGGYSNRLNPFYRPTLTYNALSATIEGSFATGALRHTTVFGAGRQALSRTLNPQSALSLFSAATAGNLYQPAPALVDTSSIDRHTFYTISTWRHQSVFASDTIAFNERWSLLAGARRVDYRNLNYAASGARTSSYRKKPTSPTVALLYKPAPAATVYASYVEALEDGGTVSAVYANANEVLPPLKSRQAELGVKTDQARWGASAALFRVRRGATYADYTADARGVLTQGGELRYQGMELNGRADLRRWLSVNAGATWLDATYRATSPAIVGNRVESTPRFQAVLGADVKVPQVAGLSLHANASYLGKQFVNSANAWTVPALTLLNAGAAWRTHVDGRWVTLRLQANNLADRRYWYSTGSNALQIGAPRTLAANLRVDL